MNGWGPHDVDHNVASLDRKERKRGKRLRNGKELSRFVVIRGSGISWAMTSKEESYGVLVGLQQERREQQQQQQQKRKRWAGLSTTRCGLTRAMQSSDADLDCDSPKLIYATDATEATLTGIKSNMSPLI